MVPTKTKPKSSKDKLAAQDWLEAAFRALTDKGPGGIKAEAIARGLGVSKGSFYWHFKDVLALKTGMLVHWEQAATGAIIDRLEQIDGSAEEKLRALMTIATSGNDDAYGGPMAEGAIRDWGRYDPAVSVVVARVDAARIHFVKGLFQQHGLRAARSQQSSRILYSALVGSQILSANKLANPKKELLMLLDLLLA